VLLKGAGLSSKVTAAELLGAKGLTNITHVKFKQKGHQHTIRVENI